jgi:WbqC-like protein family
VALKVVISQSMYFPWVGCLEQIRLADVYVRYDDVQFSKGSFTNRVQIKAESGSQWVTVPLKKFNLGAHIDEIEIDSTQNWQGKHLSVLRNAYSNAPYFQEMHQLVESVFDQPLSCIGDLAFSSQMHLLDYFGLNPALQITNAKSLGILGQSSQRVLDIVRHLKGDEYITGHGASNYLDHALFEQSGVDVQYMQYQKKIYPQLHGEFTPYVSTLDLIANCGKQGASYIRSTTCSWRQFKHEST